MEATAASATREGPLAAQHAQLGAKSGDFSGWAMPMEYAGGGVLAEHAAIRERVGLFDVSHMGTLVATGPGAQSAVNWVLTNDLSKVSPGGAQYSLLCNDAGGIVDDLLVYVRSEDEVVIVPNAASSAAVAAAVGALVGSAGVTVRDLGPQTVILAVQGPLSPEVLADLGLPTELEYLTFVDAETRYGPVMVARTGYTGERGYELLLPAAAEAARLWTDALERCRERGGLPCGLGARDTLRTEMAYPLHGQELGSEISPLQAGLSWAVGWDKPDFVGRAALLKERADGPARRLRALRCLERGVPRPGMAVRGPDPGSGEALGVVTSGTFSPTLRAGIALAMLAPGTAVGARVVIDVRGRPCRAEVVKPPFVDSDPRR